MQKWLNPPFFLTITTAAAKGIREGRIIYPMLQHLLHMVFFLGSYMEFPVPVRHPAGGALHMNDVFSQLCLSDIILTLRKHIQRVGSAGRHTPHAASRPERWARREQLGHGSKQKCGGWSGPQLEQCPAGCRANDIRQLAQVHYSTYQLGPWVSVDTLIRLSASRAGSKSAGCLACKGQGNVIYWAIWRGW